MECKDKKGGDAMQVGMYVLILWYVNRKVTMLAVIIFSSSRHRLRLDEIDGEDLRFGKYGESDLNVRFISFEV